LGEQSFHSERECRHGWGSRTRSSFHFQWGRALVGGGVVRGACVRQKMYSTEGEIWQADEKTSRERREPPLGGRYIGILLSHEGVRGGALAYRSRGDYLSLEERGR